MKLSTINIRTVPVEMTNANGETIGTLEVKRRPVTLETWQRISARYKKYTDDREAVIKAAEEAEAKGEKTEATQVEIDNLPLIQNLCEVVTALGLEDDEDKPLPVTVETFKTLDAALLVQIYNTVMEDAAVDRKKS